MSSSITWLSASARSRFSSRMQSSKFNRSFRLNFELCILLENLDLALALSQVMLDDMRVSRLLPTQRPQNFFHRLADAS
ncbi:MAG TPA: hypothetical protein PK135_06030, partial [Arenimonas sp.]|nr:hypothetical protein [Arenimonas sp.]